MISKAINSGLIYCPAKKGTQTHGCFYDPKSGIITETVQFKMKEEGSSLISPSCLSSWMKKYYNIDRLDIGFQSIEDLECNKGLLLKASALSHAKGAKLHLTFMDYSSYKSEQTCRSDIKDVLEIQASFDKIVSGVNDKMIDQYGDIITVEPMFF
jgi:hypothetical protein